MNNVNAACIYITVGRDLCLGFFLNEKYLL